MNAEGLVSVLITKFRHHFIKLVAKHCDFLVKLGLKAGDVFESIDIKPNSSTKGKQIKEGAVSKSSF